MSVLDRFREQAAADLEADARRQREIEIARRAAELELRETAPTRSREMIERRNAELDAANAEATKALREHYGKSAGRIEGWRDYDCLSLDGGARHLLFTASATSWD